MNNLEIIGLILMCIIPVGLIVMGIALSIDNHIKTINRLNRRPKHNRRFNRSTKRGY